MTPPTTPLQRWFAAEQRIDVAGLCLATVAASPPAWADLLEAITEAQRELDAAGSKLEPFDLAAHGYPTGSVMWWAATALRRRT